MAEIVGIGNQFYQAEVDSNYALKVVYGTPTWPASGGTSGGHYSVSFGVSAVTAASLAANTTLMSMRLSTGSSRKAYIEKIRVNLAVSTQGSSGLVCGALALQRFSGATPTGGTSRTPNRMSEISGNTSDMTDIMDSNAALTVTSVDFGTVVAATLVPINFPMNGSSGMDWVFELPIPVVLNPGDGLCLRTQTDMPATQTWLYSYSIYWSEE